LNFLMPAALSSQLFFYRGHGLAGLIGGFQRDISLPSIFLSQCFARLYSRRMVIGRRIRELREAKNLTQSDIEQRTGLLRPYISRVENGHTVPSIETLEKYAWALEVPLYRFFYDGEEPPRKSKLPPAGKAEPLWGTRGKQQSALRNLTKALSRMDDRKRVLLLGMAKLMAQ
jgi:transcriptional regulator with XRE-family HTH domain